MYNKKNSRSVKRNLSKKAKWHNRTTRGFKNMQNRKIKGRERCSQGKKKRNKKKRGKWKMKRGKMDRKKKGG